MHTTITTCATPQRRRGIYALAFSLLLIAASSVITPTAQAQEICYAVADNDGTPGSPDLLVQVNRNTGTETSIGALGTANVEAIAYSPFADKLYGTNAGQFGEINTTTGAFSAIGSGFGTGDGTLGNVTFSDVDGLHFDPYPGELYGVHRRGNGNDSNNDVMFVINRTTGNFIAGAFPDFDGDGSNDDYLEIRSGQAVGRWDIDDLAIDPATGTMYGAANNGGSNDELIEIDRHSGAVTLVGNMGVFDIEGLSFDTSGDLFGSSGTSGTPANSLFDINKSTGAATLVANLSDGNDYEGLACLTDGKNTITGRVYEDTDTDAIRDPGETGQAGITVRLFRDDNGNGVVDSGEPQVATQSTDSVGDYTFEVAGLGDFVVMVFRSDLPSGTYFTTDDVETASFASYGNVDSGNDFGYIAVSCIVNTFEKRVGSSSDDAEESTSDQSMYLNSSDLELVYDDFVGAIQIVGLRFTGVTILQDATIVSAYIQFQSDDDDTDTGGTSLTIQGQDIDDAPTFSSTDSDISSRTLTTASIAWAPPAWPTTGQSGSDQRTPDLSWIIQEIVNRSGWSIGNDLAIIVNGTGERTAESYDGIAGGAALLHVDWVESGCASLPVELTRFDAVADGPDVLLAWETASETNNAGFEVQHRSGTATTDDHTAWDVLGWVDGHGTTELAQQYHYRVQDLEPGRHRFRLKQIDFDGTFEYHAEVEVLVEMVERFVIEPVYPNPFNPEAQFRFAVQRSQAVRVALYDLLGRQVKVLYDGVAASGQMQAVRIDGSVLPSGLYLVRMAGTSFVDTQIVTLIK